MRKDVWDSVLIGLVESYGYGWYAMLISVPLYDVFAARDAAPPGTSIKTAP